MKNIYFIIGNNQNLIEEKIKELSRNYLRISYNNNDEYSFFNSLEINFNKSLFAENKDIIISRVEKLKRESWQRLINIIQENASQKFIFIINEEKADIFELFKENKLKFEVVPIKLPKNKELDKFIFNYLQKNNLKISNKLILFLKENYQENIDLLIHDLNNLKFINDNQKLKIETLKNLIHLQVNIFKIHDYLLEKKWSSFIHSFKKFVNNDKSQNKNDTLQALSFFINSLIRIYLIKLGKKNKLKLNSYYLQRLQEKAKHLTIEDINDLIKALARTDIKLKKFLIKPLEIPEEIVLNYIFSHKFRKL